GFGVHHAHATPATAAGRLDDDRIADVAPDAQDLGRVFRQGAVGAGYAGYAGNLHGVLGGNLVAHQADGFGARADEGEAGLFDALGEIGVFRQKAITGVDGFGVGDFGGGDDARDVQVA